MRSEPTKAEKAKFQFDYFSLMLQSGRAEEADEAWAEGMALLDELIEKETRRRLN